MDATWDVAQRRRGLDTAKTTRHVRKLRKVARLLALLAAAPISLPIIVARYRAKGHPFSAIFFKNRRYRTSQHAPRKISLEHLDSYLWSPRSHEALAELDRQRQASSPADQKYFIASRYMASWLDFAGRPADALKVLETVDGRGLEMSDRVALAILRSQLHHKSEERKLARACFDDIPDRAIDSRALLALANLEADSKGKLDVLNRIYRDAQLAELTPIDASRALSFNNISAPTSAQAPFDHGKVSVIFPVFNAADTIEISVRSILDQTYRNLQVILVDDCSTDKTPEVLSQLVDLDDRVTVVRCERNGGAYAARNIGIERANGEFITTHDSDDWSHPQKLERQVAALEEDASVVANGSHWVRMHPDMCFVSWRLDHNLIRKSYPSFMVRRAVIETLGAWDDVRVSADAEFIYRVQRKYGASRVRWIGPDVPLAFSLSHPASLTGTGETHVSSTRHGLRRYYHEAFKYQWRNGTALDEGAREERIAFTPEEIRTRRCGPRVCDAHLIGDCRSPGVVKRMSAFASDAGEKIAITHVPEVTGRVLNHFCDEFFSFLRNPNVLIAPDIGAVVAQRVIEVTNAGNHVVESSRFGGQKPDEKVEGSSDERG